MHPDHVMLTAGQIEAAADKLLGQYTADGYSKVTLPNLVNFVSALAMFTVLDEVQPDERAAFEVWAIKNGLDILPSPHWANTTFQSLPTEDSWRGWQARTTPQPTTQFEAWAKLHHYDLTRCSHEPYAAYRSDLTNAALAGWWGRDE